ncbi:hypothetical protein K3172_03435 [Qipengyuania sp. 6B39]|uniref:thermonuclease family protein n=1 Tax=Qipengyuania proteolytica TaxID=2867239 RepID=UPI001C8A89A9|nr:hypothetical protein [Qipengyuania proteolytica]MBX7494908.1 hypothetical protein [Qipengyuania proteolytica]
MPRPPRFDAAWQRRLRWRARWRTALPFALLGVLVGVWLFVGQPLREREWSTVRTHFALCGPGPTGPCVVDGDTLRFGRLHSDRRVRLTGFDAPEMDGLCEAERARARAAQAELHRWLAEGPFAWSGGSDPPRDKYGRELREARRGDDRLADHMVAAGLAAGDGWGERAIDWCS